MFLKGIRSSPGFLGMSCWSVMRGVVCLFENVLVMDGWPELIYISGLIYPSESSFPFFFMIYMSVLLFYFKYQLVQYSQVIKVSLIFKTR